MTRFSSVFALATAAMFLAAPGEANDQHKDAEKSPPVLHSFPAAGPTTAPEWFAAGREALGQRLAQVPNTKRAKNIILVIGDGMGISTLTAGRIYSGQKEGRSGEEGYLSFEEFPYTALVKTYNTDAQTADSAGTASAIMTGVKTRIGVINTAPTHPQGRCEGTQKARLKPIAELAEARGMATGIVSSARLTHATPAAVYAVAASRDWESDSDLPDGADKSECPDIARQMLGRLTGDGLDVALGGGRANFLPKDQGGRREDGRNLIHEFIAQSENGTYVADRQALAKLDVTKHDKILGLFTDSHLSYELDKTDREPTLSDLAEVAVKRLARSDKGFFLMLEGGRVDHAHHGGNAARALEETAELSKAVAKILTMVDTSETLILVTADHSHVFTMAGYPRRGNNILSVVVGPGNADGDARLAADGKPYTTLGYANGSGAVVGERPNHAHPVTIAKNYKQQALVPLRSETHGGEDVGLFAIGPWAHLARGTMEQNVIYHLMRHALTAKDQ